MRANTFIYFLVFAGIFIFIGRAPAKTSNNIRVCVPVDFNWSSYASLSLPDNLIFEDSGHFSGDLKQSDKVYIKRVGAAANSDSDGKPLEGAFITTKSVVLTKLRPCGELEARMIVIAAYTARHGTSHNHHVWLGWRVLGSSAWHDDFGKPGGLSVQLGEALDDFKIRAMLLKDLDDPVVITPEMQLRLLKGPSDLSQ